MPKKIIDEFTHLRVSPQRKTQLRNRRDGKCILCSQPLATKNHCLKHALANRKRARKRNGSRRHYHTFLDRIGLEIVDEFTDRPLPHWKKTLLRRQRDDQCQVCGEPRATKTLCLKHAKVMRERARKRLGAKRRNKGALTYRLAKKIRRRAAD